MSFENNPLYKVSVTNHKNPNGSKKPPTAKDRPNCIN